MQFERMPVFKLFKKQIGIIFLLTIVMIISIFFVILNGFQHEITSGIYTDSWIVFITALTALIFTIFFIIFFNINNYVIKPLYNFLPGIAVSGFSYLDGNENKISHIKLTDFSDIKILIKKLERLIFLIEEINKSESFEETMELVFNKFSEFIPYQYIGVAVISEDGKNVQALNGISNGMVKGLPEKLLEHKFDLYRTSLAKVIETGKPRIINDLEEFTETNLTKDYNRIILDSGIRSSVTYPLKINDRSLGFLFFSSTYKNAYTDFHIRFLHILANSIAISFSKSIMIKNIIYSSTLALARLAESRDKNTGEHLQRIGTYSKLIAKLLFSEGIYKDQITVEFIKDIEMFSPLHDIGKVAIQDSILLNPRKLTREEFDIMKTHTVYGGHILRDAENNIKKTSKGFFQMGIEIAEGHHEKWDGSGYPFGKKGEDIPLSARIVAFADVFDALTTKRPYKEALRFEKALEIISSGDGTHFDPYILEVFMKNKEEILNTYKEFNRNETKMMYDEEDSILKPDFKRLKSAI